MAEVDHTYIHTSFMYMEYKHIWWPSKHPCFVQKWSLQCFTHIWASRFWKLLLKEPYININTVSDPTKTSHSHFVMICTLQNASLTKPENGLLFSFHLKVLQLKAFKNTSCFVFFETQEKTYEKPPVFSIFLWFGYWQGHWRVHKSLFPLHDHNPVETAPNQHSMLW